MVSPESTIRLFDYGLIDDIPVSDAAFPVANSGFSWSMQPLNGSSCVRVRPESSCASSSKACREMLRRDRLNDKPPKTDKTAILNDAIQMVTQIRTEAQNLKDSNSSLQEKIKELKVEKNELRDEKQRLEGEKEKLEQQMKSMKTPPSFLSPTAMTAAFGAPGQAPGSNLVPFIGYPGVVMWQFTPLTSVYTSQDHVLRPPVA